MEEKKILKYYDKPMIRRSNKIYYGNFDDDVMIELTITGTEKSGDLEIANDVIIELKDNINGIVIKKAERENLYKAIDIAEFWLKDALGEI